MNDPKGLTRFEQTDVDTTNPKRPAALPRSAHRDHELAALFAAVRAELRPLHRPFRYQRVDRRPRPRHVHCSTSASSFAKIFTASARWCCRAGASRSATNHQPPVAPGRRRRHLEQLAPRLFRRRHAQIQRRRLEDDFAVCEDAVARRAPDCGHSAAAAPLGGSGHSAAVRIAAAVCAFRNRTNNSSLSRGCGTKSIRFRTARLRPGGAANSLRNCCAISHAGFVLGKAVRGSRL